MTRRSGRYVDDVVKRIFKDEGYHRHPSKIDHDIRLEGHRLIVEFHEPPEYEQ